MTTYDNLLLNQVRVLTKMSSISKKKTATCKQGVEVMCI